MKKTRNIASIVELLLLFVILLFVIVVITQTFMASRSQSLYARRLTEAVCLAEEVAEVTAAAADRKDAAALLDGMDQTETVTSDAEGIAADMVFHTDDRTANSYYVYVRWEEETSGSGSFAEKTIQVFPENGEEPLYTLKAGTYTAERSR